MKNNKIFGKDHHTNFYCRQFKLTAIGALLLTAAFPALAQTPNLRVCDSKGYKIKTKTAASDVTSYQWFENGTTLGTGYTTEEITFTAADRGAGVYQYVRVAYNSSCTVSSNTFTVEVLEAPVPTISASTTAVCQNGTDVEFSITPAANTTYTWSGTAGTTAGNDNSTYTVGTSTAGDINVQAKATVFYAASGGLEAKTCESELSGVKSAVVNPLPTITPTSTFARCGSGTLPLSVTVAAGGDVTSTSTITWYSDAGATNQVNTGASYTPTLTETTPYYVKAVVNATSCASPSPTTVTATVSLYEGEIDGEETN